MKRTRILLPLLLLALLPAANAQQPAGGASAPAKDGSAPYKVVDGTKVDAATFKGFQTWRSAACDRCHGAEQEGSVGPSLITSLKQRSKQDAIRLIVDGAPERGMPAYKTSPAVMDNIEQLYAYLKGRSDGAITKAKVEAIQ